MIVSGSFIHYSFKNVKKTLGSLVIIYLNFSLNAILAMCVCACMWRGGGVRKLFLTDHKGKTDSIKGVIYH